MVIVRRKHLNEKLISKYLKNPSPNDHFQHHKCNRLTVCTEGSPWDSGSCVRTWLLTSLAFSVPSCGVGCSLTTSLPADTGELGQSQILNRAFQFSQTVRWVLFLSTWFLFFQKLGHLICSNMDGPRDCHPEWSKTEKEKYHMTSLICGI